MIYLRTLTRPPRRPAGTAALQRGPGAAGLQPGTFPETIDTPERRAPANEPVE